MKLHKKKISARKIRKFIKWVAQLKIAEAQCEEGENDLKFQEEWFNFIFRLIKVSNFIQLNLLNEICLNYFTKSVKFPLGLSQFPTN